MIDEFIGNEETVKIIGDWLSAYYNNPKNVSNKYAIIFGNSGNGKTFLVSILAKLYRVELFYITPDDVTNELDANNIYKSINLKTLDNTTNKLILIDDVDEITESSFKELMFSVPKMSIYPVIYTSKSYYLQKEFIDGSLKKIVLDNKGHVKKTELLKVVKPLTSILEEYLKRKAERIGVKVSDEVLHDIALNSKSVRSAELSLYNQVVNDVLNPEKTKYELLKSISARKLQEPLTRENINMIFKSIKGYDENALRVMLKFAEFEYRIRVKNEDIDPLFVNEMIEPLEKVKFEYEYESSKPVSIESEPEEVIAPKIEKKSNVPTVDKWFT